MSKLLGIALVLAMALTLGVGGAFADTFTFDLAVGNSAISGFSGPYGTVTISTAGTVATVTLDSLTNSGNIYLFGDGSTFALNLSTTSVAVGPIVGTNAGVGFTPGLFTPTLAAGQNVDGFGAFNFTITDDDGFTHSVDHLSFTLTNASGWVSAASVVTANAQGAFGAGHVFVTSSPANAANGALVTGFAANGSAVNSPEPASLLLLGAGLAGIGLWKKRKEVLA